MPEFPDRRIGAIAARQHSVFTSVQARGVGFTRRMIQGRLDVGVWRPMHQGVYVLNGARVSNASRAMAACLATGGAAAARTAAAVWDIPAPTADKPEVIVNKRSGRSRRDIRVIRSTTMLRGDRVETLGIPITSPARTLLDLAAEIDIVHLECAIDDVLARGLATLQRLEARLARRDLSGCSGAAALRGLVSEYPEASAGSKSHLSQKFIRLFRRLGLPEPVPEMPVPLANGATIHVDLGYPDAKVAIEIQTQRWHAGRAKTQRDLQRENELELVGVSLLHLTNGDRWRPDYVRRIVTSALEPSQLGRACNP